MIAIDCLRFKPKHEIFFIICVNLRVLSQYCQQYSRGKHLLKDANAELKFCSRLTYRYFYLSFNVFLWVLLAKSYLYYFLESINTSKNQTNHHRDFDIQGSIHIHWKKPKMSGKKLSK